MLHAGEVQIHHVADFFANFMQNDQLGRIATAHLALAEHAQTTRTADCNTLCDLHSTAVDFANGRTCIRAGGGQGGGQDHNWDAIPRLHGA
jgi:RNA dependent RNA polymerase